MSNKRTDGREARDFWTDDRVGNGGDNFDFAFPPQVEAGGIECILSQSPNAMQHKSDATCSQQHKRVAVGFSQCGLNEDLCDGKLDEWSIQAAVANGSNPGKIFPYPTAVVGSHPVCLILCVGSALIVEDNQPEHKIDISDGDNHSLRQSDETEQMNSQFQHAGILVESFVNEDYVSASMEDFMNSSSGKEAEVIAGLLPQSDSVPNSSRSLTNNSPVKTRLDSKPKKHARPARELLTDAEFNDIFGSDSLLSGSGGDTWSDPHTGQSTHKTSRPAAPQAITSSAKVLVERKAKTQGKYSRI